MKSLSIPFQQHLDSGSTTLCWCWRLTRRDATVMGFTDHDRGLSFDGTDFEPDTGFSPAALANGLDMAVDAQDAHGALRSDRISETDIADGLWDGAAVEVYRVNWSDTSQRALLRVGQLGEVRRGRVAFVAEMRSLAHLLGEPIGRTIQPECDAQVGDTRCGVDLDQAAFKGVGAVDTVLRDRAFTATGLGAFADGLFDYGQLTWTSGVNAGREAMVLLHALEAGIVTLTLIDAPVLGIAAADGFEVTAGCDQTRATCRATFGNVLRFRGFPDVPPEGTVLRFAQQGKANQGDVL